MQKVIGLDLGTYSIKAVEIINTFNSYEISNFYEKIVPYDPDTPRERIIPNIMELLFHENNLTEADRIVTAMPGQYISSRIMTFNFSDSKKIEAAVASELEDYVPFQMDEMIVDQQQIGQIDKKTVVLAVMTRKAYLATFLDNLKRINIDPRLVDIDSLSFYNLSSTMDLKPGTCTALVDCGHEKTSVCIVKDGVLRMFRSINLGGKFLTEFLMRDLEMTYPEAEAAKHRVSRVINKESEIAELSPQDHEIASRLTLSLNTIVKELGRTLYAFKTWDKTPVDLLVLSGGTAQISGIDRYFSEQLMLEVKLNRLNETSLKINPDLTEHMTIMPQSVAIGMRAISSIKRVSQINLRRGEFAYVQDYEKLMRFGGVATSLFFAAALLLCLSYGLHYVVYKHRTSKIQQQFADSSEKYFRANQIPVDKNFKTKKFPDLRKTVKQRFQTEISDLSNSIQSFQEDNQGSHALIALSEISKSIPADIKVDITGFGFDVSKKGEETITIDGETDGFANNEKILGVLKKTPGLVDVVSKRADKKPGDESKIRFQVSAKFDPDFDYLKEQ